LFTLNYERRMYMKNPGVRIFKKKLNPIIFILDFESFEDR